jgi:hypothetical protein
MAKNHTSKSIPLRRTLAAAACVGALVGAPGCRPGGDRRGAAPEEGPDGRPGPAAAAEKKNAPGPEVASVAGAWNCTWTHKKKGAGGSEVVTLVETGRSIEGTMKGVEEARRYHYSGTWKGERRGDDLEFTVVENGRLQTFVKLAVVPPGRALKGTSAPKKGAPADVDYLCTR